MKAIIQRVTTARVTVGEEIVSSIGRGLCVLVGICQEDNDSDIDYMVRKLLNIRLFEDGNGKRWCRSVLDESFEILCVSQFTLYHRLKGNKPDFHQAMQGPAAEELYNKFLRKLQSSYVPEKVKDGKFGAYMQVLIQNDGPVTVELESKPSGKKETRNKSTSNCSKDNVETPES